MALPDLLSAMRSIILDQVHLPAEEPARLKFLIHQFPSLRREEAEDLARIPLSQFRIYTGTIFQGEANNLEDHFPVTLAILRELWPELKGRDFLGAQFVCELQKTRPWLGYKTLQFCTAFVDCVTEDLPEFVERVPELPELAQIEMLSLEVKRDQDVAQYWDLESDPQVLQTMTVAEVMELPFVVPWSVRFEQLNYDVVSLRQSYWTSEQVVPSDLLSPTRAVSPGEYWAVGARTPNLTSRWDLFPYGVWQFLKSVPRAQKQPLGRLAEVFVENVAPEKSEAEQFSDFIECLVRLLGLGAVALSVAPSLTRAPADT